MEGRKHLTAIATAPALGGVGDPRRARAAAGRDERLAVGPKHLGRLMSLKV
ncbi:hypothetical protein FRUB_09386 [Fimbriiglobus ruber]|uniref:Uncharacterized protein n=1 Tax=Fimbriiglobus ruber TaxID=1908690 RepID=A0A225D788_9BACT|nr:hypothetical protein FRUB_09386 [Fimbriiglobus ruber]